jgi:hypothetical protein
MPDKKCFIKGTECGEGSEEGRRAPHPALDPGYHEMIDINVLSISQTF